MARKKAKLEIHADRISEGHDAVGWQSDLQTPAMHNLLKLTDLTITFPGHHDTLKVHRQVLATSSPVFESMLFGPMAEGKELKLPEDHPEAFKWLIQYIYGGTTYLPNVHIAGDVYHLANKYQMKDLATICSKYLQTHVKELNLPFIYNAASLHEDATLQDACSDVVDQMTEDFFLLPDIEQLSRESLKHLLQQELYYRTEVSTFKGLVQWGESHVSRNPKRKSIRHAIEEFLPYVRFFEMTLGEFIEHVMPSKVLTLEECSAFLMNKKNTKNVSLPEVFSREVKRSGVSFDFTNAQKIRLYDYFAQFYQRQCTTDDEQLQCRQNGSQRECLIDMDLSKEIYLDCIILSYNTFFCESGEVEVTELYSSLLGVATTNHLPDTDDTQLIASFRPPLLMKPDVKYRINFIGDPLECTGKSFSVYDRKLEVHGYLHTEVGIDIQFWCFDN